MSKATSNNILYFKSGPATQKEVEASLNQSLVYASEKLKKPVSSRFVVNTINTKEGDPIGVSFVLVEVPQVFQMLIGNNPDSTPRFESFKDPNWVNLAFETNIEKEVRLEELLDREISGKYQDVFNEETQEMERPWIQNVSEIWEQMGELFEIENEYDVIYEAPTITQPLDPLMPLTYPFLSSHERVYLKQEKSALEKGKAKFIAPRGVIEVCRATVDIGTLTDRTGKILDVSTLMITNLPTGITAEMLKQKFILYSPKNKNYPVVKLVPGRTGTNAYISFDSTTEDAQFAMLLLKRFSININGKAIEMFLGHPVKKSFY